MGKAEGDGSTTPTPQQVLDVFHHASDLCRTRLPDVTPRIAMLAVALGMGARLPEYFGRCLRVVQTLDQFVGAVNDLLPLLDRQIGQSLPATGPALEDRRTLRDVAAFSRMIMATQCAQAALLATDSPATLKQRKDPAVMATAIYSAVKATLEGVSIHDEGSAGSIAVKVTADLINSFTTYRTTAEAVGSEVRRQLGKKPRSKDGKKRQNSPRANR